MAVWLATREDEKEESTVLLHALLQLPVASWHHDDTLCPAR
jgi:hypothetical protein